MICNFMIFSESVGSGACLSAAKIDYQSITEKAHSFTHINVKTVRFLPLPN